MPDLIDLWLQTDVVVTYVRAPYYPPDTWTRVAPTDPLRFAASLVGTGPNPVYWEFTEVQPVVASFQIGPNMNSLWVHRRDIGDLICRPLWIYPQAATFNTDIVLVSYRPERLRRYLDVAESYVSQFSSP